MKKREFLHVISGFLLIGVMGIAVSSCVSAPECPPEPEWMRSPEKEGYYVGVGSSDTGNQADDRPIAEARARADLATRISAQISSELKIETSSNNEGEYTQQVEELVNQSVETHIEDIKTVDTYYCRSAGYWVYVRLSKEKWDAIQTRRRQEVVNRVKDLLNPVLTDSNSAFIARVERLQRGAELIRGASFGQKLVGNIAGESGNLSDLVQSSIQQHFDSLGMMVKENELDVHVGEIISVEGKLTSTLTGTIGTVPVVLQNEDGDVLGESKTDPQGNFRVQLPSGLDIPGESKLLVRAKLDVFKEDAFEEIEPGEMNTLYAELLARVGLINAGLIVDIKNADVGRSVESEVRALFSDKNLPFEFSPEKVTGGYNVQVDLFVEDFPKYMEDAPDMAQAWAVVSLEYDGNSIYSYESSAVKDGGLTPAQAHSRVLTKLLKQLKAESELYLKIREALEDV